MMEQLLPEGPVSIHVLGTEVEEGIDLNDDMERIRYSCASLQRWL